MSIKERSLRQESRGEGITSEEKGGREGREGKERRKRNQRGEGERRVKKARTVSRVTINVIGYGVRSEFKLCSATN